MWTDGQTRGQTDGRKDIYDKANSRSSQFLDHANESEAIFYDHVLSAQSQNPGRQLARATAFLKFARTTRIFVSSQPGISFVTILTPRIFTDEYYTIFDLLL
jgi:hypothetical protein